MIAAQQASGKTLSIIAQNRFTDAFWRLKAALDSGLAGRVCHAQVDFLVARSLLLRPVVARHLGKRGGGCTLLTTRCTTSTRFMDVWLPVRGGGDDDQRGARQR